MTLLTPLSALSILHLPTSPPPTPTSIRSSYLRLALKLHPDRPEGDAEAFKELREAYVLLVEKGGLEEFKIWSGEAAAHAESRGRREEEGGDGDEEDVYMRRSEDERRDGRWGGAGGVPRGKANASGYTAQKPRPGGKGAPIRTPTAKATTSKESNMNATLDKDAWKSDAFESYRFDNLFGSNGPYSPGLSSPPSSPKTLRPSYFASNPKQQQTPRATTMKGKEKRSTAMEGWKVRGDGVWVWERHDEDMEDVKEQQPRSSFSVFERRGSFIDDPSLNRAQGAQSEGTRHRPAAESSSTPTQTATEWWTRFKTQLHKSTTGEHSSLNSRPGYDDFSRPNYVLQDPAVKIPLENLRGMLSGRTGRWRGLFGEKEAKPSTAGVTNAGRPVGTSAEEELGPSISSETVDSAPTSESTTLPPSLSRNAHNTRSSESTTSDCETLFDRTFEDLFGWNIDESCLQDEGLFADIWRNVASTTTTAASSRG
ncbi:hypothetical protein HDV05_008109 [Chytridiales sp. JEL 0842]|nr:hypothetical protein HDV05_008109 [Chytridiales sp. JEL 0842]